MRRLPALLMGVACLTCAYSAGAVDPAPPAAADDPARKAVAEDLFKKGVALISDGKYAEAATKLEESNRLDRAPGTTLNLADCYAHTGKLASAWSLFEEVSAIFARRSPPDSRAELAKQRAEELYPKLPRLTLQVPDAARVDGLTLKRDGIEVGSAQWGTGIPVDIGAHVIVATAPGKQPWKTEVTLKAEAEALSVTVPALTDRPSGEPPPSRRSPVPGFIIGGAGVGALVAGGILVGIAASKDGGLAAQAPKDANGNPTCGRAAVPGEDPACKDLRSTASFINVGGNTGIGLLIGGGVLAGAAAVYLLLPSSGSASSKSAHIVPVIGRDGGGLVFTGSF